MLPVLDIRLPLVIFSDLDGTLLNHQNYSWAEATPALNRLRDLGGGLVLSSSKTAAEIIDIRAAMGFSQFPAIVENGAGLLMPEEQNGAASGDYGKIRQALEKLPKALRKKFRGFGDFTSAGIAELTGLSLEQAEKAAKREFSEPGIWSGDQSELDMFAMALADDGISGVMGGRFFTLSFGASKADGLAHLRRSFAPGTRCVALGDAPNDIEMLEAADRAYVVKNSHRAPLPVLQGEENGRIKRTELEGPAGWNVAVLGEIEDITLEEKHG